MVEKTNVIVINDNPVTIGQLKQICVSVSDVELKSHQYCK